MAQARYSMTAGGRVEVWATMAAMAGPRLQITPGMRRILDYPKFRGATRVLILETGYFFDQSWVREAADLGWEARTVRSSMTEALTREDIAQLFTALGEFKPDFILTSNYAGMDVGGLFARFFEDARVPYVSWFTDTPRMILFGREMHVSPWSVAATWERAYTGHFESLGFEHIHYMPLATDPAIFNAEPPQAWERDLAFVGTSMIEQTAEAIEKHRELPRVLEAVAEAFRAGCIDHHSFSGGIDALLPADILAPLDASQRRNLELLINYEATQRQRVALAEALAPMGLLVRGDAHWLGVLSNVQGGVGYFDDLAPFYRSTAVNLNTTAIQMRWAVNQRVFDCPAAGGFLLTDEREDLDRLFDRDTELATYGSVEDLREKAAWYLARPEARRAIVEKARARVLSEHTHAHRLRSLEAYLKERFA